MRVAGQAPTTATGRLVGELKAKGQHEGEDTLEKCLPIAKQLKVRGFVSKINTCETPSTCERSVVPDTCTFFTLKVVLRFAAYTRYTAPRVVEALREGSGESTSSALSPYGVGTYSVVAPGACPSAHGRLPWAPEHVPVCGAEGAAMATPLAMGMRDGPCHRQEQHHERPLCGLATGVLLLGLPGFRPVVTQDTGFGTVLPTGEGLWACHTREEMSGFRGSAYRRR
jgi:hypothetical protein